MKELLDFEKKVWKLISEATEKQESNHLRQLTAILGHIKSLKVKAKKIENTVSKFEARIKKLGIVLPHTKGSSNSVSWEVSAVDIADAALSVEKPLRAGLIPKDGSHFLVQTSLGQVFRTGIDNIQKRLSEQVIIGQFFKGEGIRVGTKVIWTQIGPNKYSLKKAA